MRLLADENFPGDAVSALREQGHDALWIRTHAPGSLDPIVLSLAQKENRILLTFDKGFGELAFHAGLPASCGVILFRIPTTSPDFVTRRVLAVLSSRADWSGHFTVVEPDRIRMTPLPEEN